MAREDDGSVPTDTAGVRPSNEVPPPLPEPPEVKGRIHLVPTQVAGIVMVGILPVLSFFGLFGMGRGAVEGSDGPVSVRVEYPTVHRLKVRDSLGLFVTNTSGSALEAVELRVSRSYLGAFSDIAFTPGPTEVGAEDYLFVIEDLAPGETRSVAGEMQANDYWRHEGTVSWNVPDGEQGELRFATFVWP